MKNFFFAVAVTGGLLSACGTAPDTQNPQNPQPTPDPTSPTPVASYQAGLQTSGAIGFFLAGDKHTRLELSAPITPAVLILYTGEGANYPSTAADQVTLVKNSSLTFKFLLAQCAPSYPTITVPASDDQQLTAAQLALNYNAIAQCAYEKYTAKPYWIPQLIDDVDICATELGTGWRLPAEADFAALQSADIDFLNSTLSQTSMGAGGSYYFSLISYVRGADGTLQMGDLSSGVKTRLSPLGVDPGQYKYHFEHAGTSLTLRCVRSTKS